jgi:hypothetical protein
MSWATPNNKSEVLLASNAKSFKEIIMGGYYFNVTEV